jgi:hypothetical protein
MKRKRYDEGGDVMEAANASEESQDIARSMGAGPKNEEAPKAAAKPRVVSKKELEDSGMSLRDYLNRERGLTRRKEKDPTAGEARDRAAQEAADAIDPGRDMRAPRRYNSIMERPQADRDAMVKLGLQRQEAERAMKDFKAKKAAGFSKGGSVSSASRRADGIATKGKTKGTMIAMCGGGMYKK